MRSPGVPVTTEIAVTGANCPFCFNDTIELLRAEPRVIAVEASIASHCFRIDHDGADVDRLALLVRQHLHGHDDSSDERVMVEIDAQLAELHCLHGHHHMSADHREERR